MSLQLTIGQMLSVLNDPALTYRAVQLAEDLATAIEAQIPTVKVNTQEIEHWDDEIMVGFQPAGPHPGPIPYRLRGYDDEGWE